MTRIPNELDEKPSMMALSPVDRVYTFNQGVRLTEHPGSNGTAGPAWGSRCTCHEVSTFAQIFRPSQQADPPTTTNASCKPTPRAWLRFPNQETVKVFPFVIIGGPFVNL